MRSARGRAGALPVFIAAIALLGRALDEQDAITSARDEKTLRLREARLTREREARESATAALVAKRART